MAKQKLSKRQRVWIRKNLKKGLAKGTPPSELIKSLAKRYGIDGESVRWYLKSVTKGTASKPKRKKRKLSRKKRRRGPSTPNPLVLRAQAAVQEQARRSTALARLTPKYTSLLRLEKKLKLNQVAVNKRNRTIARKLVKTQSQIKSIEAQLKKLM